MMDALKFLTEQRRMCRANKNKCDTCPAYISKGDCYLMFIDGNDDDFFVFSDCFKSVIKNRYSISGKSGDFLCECKRRIGCFFANNYGIVGLVIRKNDDGIFIFNTTRCKNEDECN